MPAPASVAELLDLVQKSGVADEARLTPYLAKLTQQGKAPTEPSKLAGLLVRDGLLTYFQAEQLLQGKWKRFSIGKYKVLERLGAGGMGQVFLCEHKLMRRRVAVKVLPTAKAAEESSLKRFHREAQAIAAVDHPNIVRAYDIDQDDNLHFLVMEYVDGTNLQDLVKKFGPLDVLRACHYIYGSAVGLQHAHEIGLVHRDIKPGNILLDRSGVVKILDLGLARFFNDSDDNITKQYDENILGTADYLSPEQAEDSHTVDIRSDIYSLGATFYFLLTGSQPFPDGTIPQKLIWHRSREPKPIRSIRPEVPEEVAAVVTKMMAKKPEDRYQTPAGVMEALSPWASTPIPPPPDREMPQLSPAVAGMGGAAAPGRAPAAGPSPRSLVSPVPLISGSGGLSASAAEPGSPAGASSLAADSDAAGEAVWQSLGDTPTDAPVNTRPGHRTPAPAPRSDRPDAPPVADRPKSRTRVLVAAGALVACLAAAGGYFLFFDKKPAEPNTPGMGGSKRLIVAKGQPGAANTFPTLGEALKKAGPGDTISIAESPLVEPILRVVRMKDLTIESGLAAGKPAVIEFTNGGGGTPLCMLELLSGVENVRLKNLELDGKGVADFGVAVSGNAPGLVIENVTVRNVKSVPFRLHNASGADGRGIVLDRVRAIVSQADEAGVKVEATGTLESRFIAIRNSRIEGPGKAGVRFDGAVVGAEITGNRFYKPDVAIYLGRVAEGRHFKLQISQNTVYESKVGVQFGPAAAGVGKLDVAINRNYFARTPALAQADAPVNGLTSADNGFVEAGSGNVPIISSPVPNPKLSPPNPDDDATFLRFPAGNPTVGSGPVGAN